MLEFYIHSLAGVAFLLGLTVISTSLSCSATCTFLSLPFFTAEMFLGQDYRICTCPIPLHIVVLAMLWRLDTLLKESVDWKN